MRLPYGERTGNETVDTVMLTAHDKFTEILEEAQRGDSIFKAENVIKIEELEETASPGLTQLTLSFPSDTAEEAYEYTQLPQSAELDKAFETLKPIIETEVDNSFQEKQHKTTPQEIEEIAKRVLEKAEKDLGKIYQENANPLSSWIRHKTERAYVEVKNHFIPIPQIKVTDAGMEDYGFDEFDLDLTAFNHAPIGDDKLIIQNLLDPADRQYIKGGVIDFGAVDPVKTILTELCKKPEIDYKKWAGLILKLIMSVCDKYREQYDTRGLCNIVMMNKYDIANDIYRQMLKHLHYENGFLHEEVIGNREENIRPNYNYKKEANLYEPITGNIGSILFTGIKKGVFTSAKFDSYQGEVTFARLLERDNDVQNWLRPAPLEFNITYGSGKRYEPDFVVETPKIIYLTEIKGEDRIGDPDVIAKRQRGITYCEIASRWGRANGFKDWQYLFIPAGEITASSSFGQLAQRFGTYGTYGASRK